MYFCHLFPYTFLSSMFFSSKYPYKNNVKRERETKQFPLKVKNLIKLSPKPLSAYLETYLINNTSPFALPPPPLGTINKGNHRYSIRDLSHVKSFSYPFSHLHFLPFSISSTPPLLHLLYSSPSLPSLLLSFTPSLSPPPFSISPNFPHDILHPSLSPPHRHLPFSLSTTPCNT